QPAGRLGGGSRAPPQPAPPVPVPESGEADIGREPRRSLCRAPAQPGVRAAALSHRRPGDEARTPRCRSPLSPRDRRRSRDGHRGPGTRGDLRTVSFTRHTARVGGRRHARVHRAPRRGLRPEGHLEVDRYADPSPSRPSGTEEPRHLRDPARRTHASPAPPRTIRPRPLGRSGGHGGRWGRCRGRLTKKTEKRQCVDSPGPSTFRWPDNVPQVPNVYPRRGGGGPAEECTACPQKMYHSATFPPCSDWEIGMMLEVYGAGKTPQLSPCLSEAFRSLAARDGVLVGMP